MNSRGIVYVVSGAKFIKEAEESATYCKQKNPNLKYCIITEQKVTNPLWDDVVFLEEPTFSSRDKMRMHLCPYEKAIFLDSDTYVTVDLSEVFDLLDHFDIAAYQESSGFHYKIPEVPNAFPEFNSGVIAFRKSPQLLDFFSAWESFYELYYAEQKKAGRVWDQKSFRHAMYASKLRIATLPHEFNFMPYFPGYAMTELKIIHGRNFENVKRLEKRMNKNLGHRVYLPRIGVIYNYDQMSYRQYINLLYRVTGVFLIEIYRRTKLKFSVK
jgi:hypothetical protein